jgi:hypothetical protein
VKISGSVEEGSPPGSDPSGAAPGKKAESSAMIAWRKSPGEKVPAFLAFWCAIWYLFIQVNTSGAANILLHLPPLHDDRKE